MKHLYDEYVAGVAAARGLFEHPPETPSPVCHGGGAWADGVAEAVNTRNAGKTPLTGTETVLATGQQPGLFTGPLYTIYKAVTAVKLASCAHSEQHPCVPVFWVAGDDHDFEESRTAHFYTKRHELLSLSYAPTSHDVTDMPLYRIPLEAQLHGFIDAAAAACRGGEFSAEVRDFLHDTLDASDSMAAWFAQIMSRLFASSPLRLFCPWDNDARRGAVPILAREIEHPLAGVRLLEERGRLLAELGYAIPIQRDADACNFFVERDGRRRKVRFQEGRYRIAGENDGLTVDAMLGLLADTPEIFSPNVALRPVVQQQLFPVAAYVAGPGEVAYWAQLHPLFAFFDQPMPVVYPRIRCVLSTPKVRQLMRLYDFDIKALTAREDLLARALRATTTDPAGKAVANGRVAMADALAAMMRDLRAQGASRNAMRAAERFERNTQTGMERLERRLAYADKEKRRTVEARVNRMFTLLAPMRKPQERVLSIFSFMFEHGWPLVDRMEETLTLDNDALQEMEL